MGLGLLVEEFEEISEDEWMKQQANEIDIIEEYDMIKEDNKERALLVRDDSMERMRT